MPTTTNEAATPTIADLTVEGAEAVTNAKERYARLRVNGKTIAYATQRKEFVVLKLNEGRIADAPKRFQGLFEPKNGGKVKIHVTGRNLKTAQALLEWVGKQETAAA